MKNVSILVPCKSCNKKVNYADLRRNEQGLFVCSNCLGHTYDKTNEIPSLIKKKVKVQEQMFKQPPSKKVLYCSNCKFTFTHPWNSSELKGCPYCNQKHSVQVKQTATDLLKNIDTYIE